MLRRLFSRLLASKKLGDSFLVLGKWMAGKDKLLWSVDDQQVTE